MKRHILNMHKEKTGKNMEEENESAITVLEEANTTKDVSTNPPANEYAGLGSQGSNQTVVDISNVNVSKEIVDVLKTTNLMQCDELFRKQDIDLEMLKGLNDSKFMDMF